MRVLLNILVAGIGVLALVSGLAKVMLAPAEVEFFGAFGIPNALLVVFGMVQLAGGILLFVPRTRIYGAMLIAATFVLSAVILVLAGNYPMAAITGVAILVLLAILKLQRPAGLPPGQG